MASLLYIRLIYESGRMSREQRIYIRNKLLLACFGSSIAGVVGAAGYFLTAFNVTMTHVVWIMIPTVVVLAADGIAQFIANDNYLRRVFLWIENEEYRSDVEWTRAAQLEMLHFPYKASVVSMTLWITSALFITLLMAILRSPFSAWQLFTIALVICCGGPMSLLFQFNIYKRIFRKYCSELMSAETGLHREQTTGKLDIRAKYLFGVIVILSVGMIYAGLMGNNRAAEALKMRAAQLILKAGKQVLLMESAHDSNEKITARLEETASQIEQEIFIFDERGEVVYGKLPGDVNSDLIRKYMNEFRNPLIGMIWFKFYYSRNISGSSNEFLWTPMDEHRYVGTMFYRGVADGVLGGFNWSIIALAIFFISIAFVMAYLAATDISEPLSLMLDLTERISTGDLTENVNLLSDDEIGRLAAGLQAMTEELRGMLARIGTAAEQVDRAAFDITESQSHVTEGTKRQAASVDESSGIARDLHQIVNDIMENIEVMAENTKESAKSIIEMEGFANELSENAKELSLAVETTGNTIYEMSASIGDITDGVEVLTKVAEETASSTMQMDRAITEVEEHARETLRISATVTEDAGRGVASVQSTISGIGRIEEGVREASEVILHLGAHAEEIGKIVNVITDVADQTKLLALNAAIIAAQAGERGRSFAVVADEIKKLSERTTSSTKEIRDLIASVQSETQRAVDVMKVEGESVEDGVNLAFQAGQALEKIQKSAQKSADMANSIASATTQQALSSKRVTEAVSAIAERVSQISTALREQAKGAEHITQATGQMREISPMVRMKAQKQAESGKQVTLAMENITEMVNYVLKSQQRQQEQAERILIAMNQINNILKENAQTISMLDATIGVLSRQSEGLRTEVSRFRLPEGMNKKPVA